MSYLRGRKEHIDLDRNSFDIRSSTLGEQSMDTLYSWEARRAGGRITITHSCGKVVGVDTIQPMNGKVIATDKNARQYVLHVA